MHPGAAAEFCLHAGWCVRAVKCAWWALHMGTPQSQSWQVVNPLTHDMFTLHNLPVKNFAKL